MPVVGTVVQTEYPKVDDTFRIFPVPHNWSDAFRYSVEFLTDIIVSVNGKEQRRAVRERPRFTCEFVGNVVGHVRLNLDNLMTSWQAEQVVFGLEHLALTTTAVMAPEDMSATFAPAEPGQAPFWLEDGDRVIIVHGKDLAIRESRTIETFGTSSMSFAESTLTEFPVGSRIMPGWMGFLSQEQTSVRLTNTAGTASFPVQFRPASGGQQVPEIGTPVYVGTLEVFPFKPNWGGGNEVGFNWLHNIIDFPYGQWRNWKPIEFPSRMYKFAFSTKTLRAVYANRDGIVIGRTEAPLVNSGDAVVHIADLPLDVLRANSAVVVDAGNYYPTRDGTVAQVEPDSNAARRPGRTSARDCQSGRVAATARAQTP